MSALFSFIGSGNMGGALARAAAQKLEASDILLANRTAAKAEALAAQLGCRVGTNADAAAEGKYIFLGVKPQMMRGMLDGIAPVLKARTDRFILVTMAAGLTMEQISAMAGGDYPVIRIMPNTPCAIGEGMILYAANDKITAEELAFFTDALSGAGLLDELDDECIVYNDDEPLFHDEDSAKLRKKKTVPDDDEDEGHGFNLHM